MFYLICATPRVGSNFLCDLLFRTRVAGQPKEFLCHTEVLNKGAEFCGFRSLAEGTRELNSYFDVMKREFNNEGVFGAKAHFQQFQWALDQGFDLGRHFPDRFLFCTRADVLGQAISYLRASQTSEWIHDHQSRGEPRFDAEILRAVIHQLVKENQCWESIFETLGVEPYRVSYERLCEDLPGELSEIMRFLDFDPAKVDVAKAVADGTHRFRVQRDETTFEWRLRYAEYLHQLAREQSKAMAVPSRAPALT